MRKIVAAAFVSLDGVMQAPGGPEEDPTGGFPHGGWTFHGWDKVMEERMGATFAEPYDLLLGRKTYEIFAAHWPFAPAEDPIAQQFNAVTKYVVTRSDAPLQWKGSRRVSGTAELAEIKRAEGPTLLVQGSSDLIQSLLAEGLIDEFRLLVFPVLLGKGKRLFGDGTVPMALDLVASTTSTTGVTIATYRPAGPVRTGSFQFSEPSEAELTRREKMNREG
jgi:dihydrofolate reductase